MDVVLKAGFLLGLGIIEGYAFARVGLLPPQAMEDQMLFRSFIIAKLFLSAVGASMLFQAIMAMVTPNSFNKSRFYGQFAVGWLRSIGGCFMIGIGMELAGSGPTLLPSQMGVGVTSAPVILSGLIIGGILWAIFEKFVFPEPEKCVIPKPGRKITVEDLVGGSYKFLALAGGLMLLLGVALMEVFLPHSEAVEKTGVNFTNPILPIFAGIVVGANQIPLRYLTGDGQGGSTSPLNVVATLTFGLLSPRHRIKDFPGAAQLLYVYGGTMLGAYVGSDLPNIDGFNFWRSLCGGILMMIGARIANGCTCGHGISGMSELSLESILAACSIFGGGIATALVIHFAF